MYSVPTPTPHYDIHLKDFSHPSYAGQFNGHFNTGSGEPSYPQYSNQFNEILAPTFQDSNGALYHQAPDGGLLASASYQSGYAFDEGLAPAFQYQISPLSGNTPGSSSQFSSSSFETTLNQPGPSLGNIPQLYSERDENIPQLTAADLVPVASGRRTRGPNKRPPGTGFTHLLHKLPWEVRIPLEAYYPGCCKQKNKPGQNCSRQKHLFSIKHCSKVGDDMQRLLPFFVCPAFIALHAQCRSAKAGRYDSAERHCLSCPGYEEMNSARNVFPVEITQREYKALADYRAASNTSSEETTRLAAIPVQRLLAMMIKAGMPLETTEPDVSDAMNVAPAPAQPLEHFLTR